jgi:2-dehydro-3-deoxyphosphooctonate aldolase (KDO 8-P synthase)
MSFNVGQIKIGLEQNMFAMLGPCVIEGLASCLEIAQELFQIQSRTDIGIIFKGSFDKANRSSVYGYRGVRMYEGLNILKEVRQRTGLPVMTDIHTPKQAEIAARFVDVLQIPAFLCRQTDLLCEAAKTGLPINIKKGQFQAPWDMQHVVIKIKDVDDNAKIILTERGTTFGYNRYVNDMVGISIMQQFCPVVFDATHSVQRPGTSHGNYWREGIILAKAGIASGANGLFMEVHPDPPHSKCDASTVMPLSLVEEILVTCKKIWEIV